MSSRFSSNSEATAKKNIEEMFPRYYMGSDTIIRFRSSTTHCCVTRHIEWIKLSWLDKDILIYPNPFLCFAVVILFTNTNCHVMWEK